VEAIVRIGLMALMLAVTAPVLSRVLQQFELRGACQRVFSELQEARMASLTQNRRYRWEVVDTQTYRMSRYDVVANDWSVVRTGDLIRDGRNITLTTAAPIVFSPNGSSPSAGTITLTGAGGTTLQVTVRTNGSIAIQ